MPTRSIKRAALPGQGQRCVSAANEVQHHLVRRVVRNRNHGSGGKIVQQVFNDCQAAHGSFSLVEGSLPGLPFE